MLTEWSWCRSPLGEVYDVSHNSVFQGGQIRSIEKVRCRDTWQYPSNPHTQMFPGLGCGIMVHNISEQDEGLWRLTRAGVLTFF